MMWPFRRLRTPVRQLSPLEARQELLNGDVLLVDVREDFEFRHCRIEGAVHIPLRQLLQSGEPPLDPEKQIICCCHHGSRSQRAALHLLSSGFPNVANLVGGIHAWSMEVDPGIPTY